ncbi:MAG: hypothetical protein CL777_01400 [Chloroflexi bacterium]|nr:hypothetical protein [Chloroflexota bacterium]
MKKDLLGILACPVDKNSLELIIQDENNNEIINGSLVCTSCSTTFPIVNSIPNFLI